MEKLTLSERSIKGVEKAKELLLIRKQKYNLYPNKCLYCENSLSYDKKNNKFCSRSCSASHNNIGKLRNYNYYNNVYTGNRLIKNKCLHCNIETKNKLYCTKKCKDLHVISLINDEVIKSGIVIGVPETVKKYMIKTQGYICKVCGLVEWCGKQAPLVLDHINGNSTDNKLNNLRLLCQNCNAQTDTFCGKHIKTNGIGIGRLYRRRYYQENKD